MKRVLITGATGFVGGHVLLQLYLAQYHIRATYRRAYFEELKLICKVYKVDFAVLFRTIDWVKVDLLDRVALDRACFDIDEIYHCAAVVNFSDAQAQQIQDFNIESTRNVTQTALRKSIAKVCYMSSIGALKGKRMSDGMTDESCFEDNQGTASPYSYSKQAAEKVVWQAIAEGLHAVILNPGIILGPGRLDKGGNLLIEQVQRGMRCYTMGATGYIDVRDVAAIARYAMEHDIVDQRIICVSENLSYKQLFDVIATQLGQRKPWIRIYTPYVYVLLAAVKVSNFFRKRPSPLTKQTLHSAFKQLAFDATRQQTLIPLSLRSIEESVRDTIALHQ